MNKQVMAAAIATAKEMVQLTKKQETAIPIILAACGCQKAEKPWVVAKELLVEYARRVRIPLALREQREVLVSLESRLTHLRERLGVKYDRVLNDELVKTHGNYMRAQAHFEFLKNKHSIVGKLADIEASIEKMGLMDLIGIRASDLTSAKKAVFSPVPKMKLELKRTSMQDIVAEYGLSERDRQIAEFIAYLRNTTIKVRVKVKRHSKPQRRAAVDENAVKLACWHANQERRQRAIERYAACYKGVRTPAVA